MNDYVGFNYMVVTITNGKANLELYNGNGYVHEGPLYYATTNDNPDGGTRTLWSSNVTTFLTNDCSNSVSVTIGMTAYGIRADGNAVPLGSLYFGYEYSNGIFCYDKPR